MVGSSEPDDASDMRDTVSMLRPEEQQAAAAAAAAAQEAIAQEPQRAPESYSWYQPERYRYLFNVDDREVFSRLKKSLVPWSLYPFPPNFLQTIRVNPDLYGPFWITITVVFLMAAAGNFGSYLNEVINRRNSDNWEPDFDFVSFSAFAILGYNTIVPFLLWAACKFFNIALSLIDCLCIYGYALFIFIPITIVSVAPIEWFRWTMVAAAGAVSTVFLVANLWNELRQNSQYGLIIALVVALLHVGLALTFKLVFFGGVSTIDVNNNSTTKAAEFFF